MTNFSFRFLTQKQQTGLLPISKGYWVILVRIYAQIGSSPHSIKNVNKTDTLRRRIELGMRKMFCVSVRKVLKIIGFLLLRFG